MQHNPSESDAARRNGSVAGQRSYPLAPSAKSGGQSFFPEMIFWGALSVILVIRLWECTLLPAKTGDIYRHIMTALMVHDQGWSAVNLPLITWSAGCAAIAPWADHSYNYPPVTLAFFYVLAALSPTVLAAKLVLTCAEALNGWLVLRLTGDRWMAACYWALPLSIWWVSREAQIEPLQNSLLLLALIGSKAAYASSIAAWISACQVKISAVFGWPHMLAAWWALPKQKRWRAVMWGVLALTPTALALFAWPVIRQTLTTVRWEVTYNLWHWRSLFDQRYAGWASWPLLLWIHVATTALTCAVIIAWRRGVYSWERAAACIFFLFAANFMGVFQGWYFLALVPFVLTACSRLWRYLLLALVQLSEPLSCYQLLVRPIGWGAPSAVITIAQPLRKP